MVPALCDASSNAGPPTSLGTCHIIVDRVLMEALHYDR